MPDSLDVVCWFHCPFHSTQRIATVSWKYCGMRGKYFKYL
jgi:hypothetical protein